jgi:CDP-paratose 2-epimerase
MRRQGKPRHILITGGAGFIGCNLADSLLSAGEEVAILDDLSRSGVDHNLAWLKQRHGGRITAYVQDVRDARALQPAVAEAAAIFHLAAQTAVTTSLTDPVEDFEVNARGTLNVLEAARKAGDVPVIFASTNKVYGGLADLETSNVSGCHLPLDAGLRLRGIGEARPLDFSTPYGCSKGVADQYVLDYAKSYGMRTAVLRMSCIYGPRQFGTEDQGWVAHFLIRALRGMPITIYGDGLQVRDVLHVSDAVAAYRALLADIDRLRGNAFNLGGGPANAVSLQKVLGAIGDAIGHPPEICHAEPRTGDQLYFVADTTRLYEATGWRPVTGWRDGITALAEWFSRHRVKGALVDRFVA